MKETLTGREIQLKNLQTTALGRPAIYLEQSGSTNGDVKIHADALSHGTAVYTMNQTAGKGRRGKSWDGGGMSLALSVYLKGMPMRSTAELPLYCGLAVAEGLEGLTGFPCALKWPNDVLIGGKKLAGILCEGFASNGESATVAGIGVNLYRREEDFLRVGLPHATSLLSETGRRYEPETVMAAILNALERVMLACEADGFDRVRDRYIEKCVNMGKEVRIIYDNRERTGTAIGIGSDGSLLVDCAGETVTVQSGEASVRGLYGYTG